MTPKEVEGWAKEMRLKGIARSDAACARLLDIHPNSFVKMKQRGADRRTSLACKNLLHNLGPYVPETPAPKRPVFGS